MRSLALFIAGCGVTAVASVCAAPAEVQLRARVSVPAGDVLLGDVAAVRSADLDTVRRLVSLRIAALPAPGAQRVVERETVRRKLTEALGTLASEVTLSGAPESTISCPAHEISGHAIEQAARVAVRGWLAERQVPQHVELAQGVSDVLLPAGQVALHVRPINLRPLSSRQTVWVDLTINEKPVRSVPVAYLIPGATVLADEPVIAGRATSPALSEVPRSSADAIAQPGARRGQKLVLIARQGDMELRSSGDALSDANVGEPVRVRVANAPSPVIARVIAPGRAEVSP